MEKQNISLDEYFKTTGTRQNFFSEKTGISLTLITQYKKGTTVPTLPKLRLICEHTNGLVTIFSPWGNELHKKWKPMENIAETENSKGILG